MLDKLEHSMGMFNLHQDLVKSLSTRLLRLRYQLSTSSRRFTNPEGRIQIHRQLLAELCLTYETAIR